MGRGLGKLAPGEGSSRPKLAPRRRSRPPEAGARRGTGRLKLAPARARPPEADARHERGRLGHDPGRLWPCPRRPGMKGVQASSPGRDAIVNEDRLRDEDAGNVTVPRVFLMTSRASQTRNRLLGAYRDPNIGSAFPDLDSGPEEGRKCDVPGIFLTASSRSGPPGPRSRPERLGRTFTEVENRVGLLSHPRFPTVPGVSWRPQPARAATRRPGRTSDGRPGPEARRNSDGRERPRSTPHLGRPRRPRSTPHLDRPPHPKHAAPRGEPPRIPPTSGQESTPALPLPRGSPRRRRSAPAPSARRRCRRGARPRAPGGRGRAPRRCPAARRCRVPPWTIAVGIARIERAAARPADRARRRSLPPA